MKSFENSMEKGIKSADFEFDGILFSILNFLKTKDSLPKNEVKNYFKANKYHFFELSQKLNSLLYYISLEMIDDEDFLSFIERYLKNLKDIKNKEVK